MPWPKGQEEEEECRDRLRAAKRQGAEKGRGEEGELPLHLSSPLLHCHSAPPVPASLPSV